MEDFIQQNGLAIAWELFHKDLDEVGETSVEWSNPPYHMIRLLFPSYYPAEDQNLVELAEGSTLSVTQQERLYNEWRARGGGSKVKAPDSEHNGWRVLKYPNISPCRDKEGLVSLEPPQCLAEE